MARVEKFERVTMDRNSVHDPVHCTYATFTDDSGRRYIQFDTYGSGARKILGKKSQSIQLDEDSARRLAKLLAEEGFS